MPPMIIVVMNRNQNELAKSLKHEGIRVGEIFAHRAWAVIQPRWFRSGDDRLHSVLMRDYIWHPDEQPPAMCERTAFIRSKT